MEIEKNGRLRILLVEDEEEQYLKIDEMLFRLGRFDLSVHWVDTFPAACQWIAEKAFDLLLIDSHLECGVSGLDVMREAIRLGSSAPAVFLVGPGGWEEERLAIRAGEDVLEKEEMTLSGLDRAIRYAVARGADREAVRESRKQYERLEAASRDRLFSWDLIPSDVDRTWLDRVHPDDRDRLRRELDEFLEGSGDCFEAEYRIVDPEGNVRQMYRRGWAKRDSEGRPLRLAGSVSDVTRRQLELERVLSHLSHELRTPLNAGLQFLELLEDGLAGSLTLEQARCLESALRETSDLQASIECWMSRIRAPVRSG